MSIDCHVRAGSLRKKNDMQQNLVEFPFSIYHNLVQRSSSYCGVFLSPAVSTRLSRDKRNINLVVMKAFGEKKFCLCLPALCYETGRRKMLLLTTCFHRVDCTSNRSSCFVRM